ncbi:MAG: DNA alkylation repair protein [Candidatus Heimdallarchaeota archaeon]|nr:DNA alkylation repair protein [Candidatus Heimdallarchaeota archaeon]
MKWERLIYEWLTDKSNSNQNLESKTNFAKTTFQSESTSLNAVGISNPSLRKKVLEARTMSCYFLSKYKKHVDKTLFNHINSVWIDLIDHWTLSDHLCIDAFANLDLNQISYTKEIKKWVKNENFWRRRLSVTIYLKHLRKHEWAGLLALENIDKLKEDTNYYVRKSFSWVLRESSKVMKENISAYLINNVGYFNKTELHEASKYCDQGFKTELLDTYDQLKIS